MNATDPTGMACNSERTECWSDNFIEGKSRARGEYTPKDAQAVYDARASFKEPAGREQLEPTGVINASGAVEVQTATDGTGPGRWDSADSQNATFTIRASDRAGVHGHTGGTIADDPSENRGYGDTMSLEAGKPMYTVEGDRVGVHDAPGGHLRFKMTSGVMTKEEAEKIDENLQKQQRKFQSPKPK